MKTNKYKRIAWYCLLGYLVVAPISLLFEWQPKFGLQQFIGYRDSLHVEGEIIYSRGMIVNDISILEGRANYSYETERSSHSSSDNEKILGAIQSGKTSISEVKWRFNWEQFAFGYLNLLLLALLITYAIRKKPTQVEPTLT